MWFYIRHFNPLRRGIDGRYNGRILFDHFVASFLCFIEGHPTVMPSCQSIIIPIKHTQHHLTYNLGSAFAGPSLFFLNTFM